MKVESPKFKRCCFCMPLRRGLICWGYFNIVVYALAILRLALLLFAFRDSNRIVHYDAVGTFIAVLLIQSAFNIVLVVASHKKSAKLLKVSYVYCIVCLVLLLGVGAFATYWELKMVYIWWEYYKSSIDRRILRVFYALAPLFVQLFVQMYMTLLIRSEMVKLRNQSMEMRFINNAAEAEARCVSADQVDDPDIERVL